MSFESTNLMSIAKVVTGKHDANHADKNGQYRFYTCASEFSKCNTYNFQGECIILPGNGANVGDAYFYDGKFDAYQRTYVVHDIDKKRIIPKFLHYNFLHNWKTIGTAQQFGSATNYIKIGNFENYRVACPSINIQRNAISELDLLTEIINKQKQQLKELDTLAQSIFYDMFGSPDANEKEWIMKSLAEIGTIVSGSTPSTSDESNWDGDVNWVTPAELGVQLFYGETRRKITSKAAKSLTIMPIGTLLMSSRAPIGKLAITSVPMCCNQGFKNIVCGNNVNNIYLYYCLMLNINSIKAMGRGATFKEVSKQAVSSFEIMLPPMNLQELFAQKILSIESQKKSINRSIAESQKLFDYTMDKYFG